LLQENGKNPEIIEYLENPPTKDDIKFLLKLLKIPAIDLIRRNEPQFEKYKNLDLSPTRLINLMAKYPRLIQRPILIEGNKALIGRPVERVLDL